MSTCSKETLKEIPVTKDNEHQNKETQLKPEKEVQLSKKQREQFEKGMCIIILCSIHPETKTDMEVTFVVHKDKSLQEATQEAHKLLKYDGIVPVEQCRLVKYDMLNELMEQSFDGQENSPISVVLGGHLEYYNFDLFLEVRGKDEQFKVYKPGGVFIAVTVVNLESDQVLPPVTVKGEKSWTIAELKKFLKSEFKLKGDVVRVVLDDLIHVDLKPLVNDENTLKSEMIYRLNQVYLECSFSDDHKLRFQESYMYKLIDKHMNAIELTFNLPAVGTAVNGEAKVLTIDRRTIVSEVKKMLEPFVKLPSNQFILCRVYSNNQEFEMVKDDFSMMPSKSKYNIRLRRALNPGEYRIKLFLLRMKEIEFSKFLVDSVCVKGSKIIDFKKQILEDLIEQKVEEVKDVAAYRIRLRMKISRNPATIIHDHMIIDKDVKVYTNCEMYIEIIEGSHALILPFQMQVFIRRWRPSTYTLDTCDEIIITFVTPGHLKQQIAEKAGFPAERVEFARPFGPFPCDVSPLKIQDLKWNPQIASINDKPLSLTDDGAVLYYRDSKETLGILTPERKDEIQRQYDARIRSSAGLCSSKEKPLKI